MRRVFEFGNLVAVQAALAIVLASGTAASCSAQVVVADPEFAKVGFDRWVAEGSRSDIPWKLEVSTHGLTYFERFAAHTEVRVPADAVAHRAGNGQMLFFVQFTDEHGLAFQSHNHIDLADAQGAHGDAIFSQNILTIPGDYRVDFAVFDTATEERSVAQRTLHIAPLHNDPLLNSWDGADSVEIVPDLAAPDKWFLPRATDKLHLPIESHAAVDLQIIASGGWSKQLAAEKVLSQIEVSRGTSDFALLNYERRSVSYDQDLAQPLDWAQFKAALATMDPNVINAQALAGRRENLEFFLDEIARRITAAQAPSPDGETAPRPLPVFVVISPPWDFRDGEKVHPIQVSEDSHCLVFYIRFHAPNTQEFRVSGAPAADDFPGIAASVGDVAPSGSQQSGSVDFLSHTLAPLHPRVFDVASPEEFRKALATILHDIAKRSETWKGSK